MCVQSCTSQFCETEVDKQRRDIACCFLSWFWFFQEINCSLSIIQTAECVTQLLLNPHVTDIRWSIWWCISNLKRFKGTKSPIVDIFSSDSNNCHKNNKHEGLQKIYLQWSGSCGPHLQLHHGHHCLDAALESWDPTPTPTGWSCTAEKRARGHCW